MTNQLEVTKDVAAKKIKVSRNFSASVEDVWRAWSESELLDQWWAPRPYRAVTKSMDFTPGGAWLYAMMGPEGDRHNCKLQYKSIDTGKKFTAINGFCDEQGNFTLDVPPMSWTSDFIAEGDNTRVVVELVFDSEASLRQLIDMGFEQGFTAALSNLEEYLRTGFMLRQQHKVSNTARVATYLNFPGNTEEAFNFYKKVFRGSFTGRGLQRFGDVSFPGDQAMSEEHKKLIIHAELTILGGHVLMATDAPESMGFNLVQGNNMHINLEPETREETERLFKELSEGGEVSMPLQDMFWGAYFGSFKDKFGINWMLNCQTAGGNGD